jgi:4-hydroxyphenylpyruvate dioxygenase-like putative hemolysin
LLEQCRLRIGVGTLKNAARIELIQPVEGDTPQAQFLMETGPGLHHIAFSTNNHEKWREHFEAQGAEFVFEAEAEDDIIGYRRSLYARVSGMVGIVEITETGRKRK